MDEPEIQTDDEKLEDEHFDIGDKLMVLFTLILSGMFIATTYFTKMGVI